eukprot:649652-Rhodomonas_salina.3
MAQLDVGLWLVAMRNCVLVSCAPQNRNHHSESSVVAQVMRPQRALASEYGKLEQRPQTQWA